MIDKDSITKTTLSSQINKTPASFNSQKELFNLSFETLTEPVFRNALKEAFQGDLNFNEKLKAQGFNVTKRIDKELTEGQFMTLLHRNLQFKNLIKEYVRAPLKDFNIDSFLQDFDTLDKEISLRKQASLLNPLKEYVLTEKDNIKSIEIYVNHKTSDSSGKTIEATDLVSKYIKFIQSVRGDIFVNVFDFDLENIAQELVLKSKKGQSVTVGIDQNNIDNKLEVQKIVSLLKKGGVKVIPIDSVGLNHQKIIVGDNRVLLSSGDFTQSELRPLEAHTNSTHRKLIPNANHGMVVRSQMLASLFKYELRKTFKGLRGQQYPISSFYKLPYTSDPNSSQSQKYMTIAFAPGGGLRDILKNILAPRIKASQGELFITTFAFSKVIEDALLYRLKNDPLAQNSFLSVSDFSFAIQPWSVFLNLLGYEKLTDKNTDLKYYKKIKPSENRWLKELGEKAYENIRRNIMTSPKYKNFNLELNRESLDLTSKVHHKLIAISSQETLVGSSFNFSKSSQNNQEQFVLVHDPDVTRKTIRLVKGLAQGGESVLKKIEEKNKFFIHRNKMAKKALNKIMKEFEKQQFDRIKIQSLISEFKKITSYKDVKIRKILQRSALSHVEKGKQIGHRSVTFNFDIDNNILELQTKILVFHKDNPRKVKEIGGAKWAHVKNKIGQKETPYENYRIDKNSFSQFEDIDGVDTLTAQLKKVINTPGYKWRGPVWNEFVQALSNPITAKSTNFITARGHSREGILKMIKHLQTLGYIKYLPEKKNIWAITGPKVHEDFQKRFGSKLSQASVDNPSLAKSEIMIELLNELNKKPLYENDLLLTKSGNVKKSQKYHLWGFSDDDKDNFEKARKSLQKHINNNQWPNVKITLYYTGQHKIKGHKAIVLRPHKKPRALEPIEVLEWVKLFSSKEALLCLDLF